MTVFKFEVKKLVSSVSLWILLLVFFAFNLFLISTTRWDPYPDFVGEVAKTTGIVLDEAFSERLKNVSVDAADEEWLDSLKEDTSQLVDHFDHYDITEVGEQYINYLNAIDNEKLPESVEQKIQEKYAEMQQVVREKGQEDEALSLYHASATTTMHENLFDTIFGWLLVEGILLSVLLALLSIGYEKGNETEAFVFTTKTGRNLVATKLGASLLAGFSIYLFLTAATLLVYFTLHDYSAIWHSSVSNIFNFRQDLIAGYRPFVTWQSHTILTYLLSKIGVALGLFTCFILLAFIVELRIRNSYLSFIVTLVLNALLVVIPLVSSNIYLSYYITLSPVWLWLKHTLWFTDGDIDILWRHFEWTGSFFSILFLLLGAVTGFNRFKRRDIL